MMTRATAAALRPFLEWVVLAFATAAAVLVVSGLSGVGGGFCG